MQWYFCFLPAVLGLDSSWNWSCLHDYIPRRSEGETKAVYFFWKYERKTKCKKLETLVPGIRILQGWWWRGNANPNLAVNVLAALPQSYPNPFRILYIKRETLHNNQKLYNKRNFAIPDHRPLKANHINCPTPFLEEVYGVTDFYQSLRWHSYQCKRLSPLRLRV